MKIIAENLHAFNPVVARALKEEDAATIQDLVRGYELSGAHALDINPGYDRKQGPGRMRFLVEAVQAVSSLPLFIDSPDPDVMEAGLKACRNPAVVNFFTAEKDRLRRFLPLVEKYGALAVAAVMEKQVPLAAEDKLALASVLVKEAQDHGVEAHRLIFDPIVIPLGWGDGQRYARETLKFLEVLPQVFDFRPQTVVGLSNLTSRAAGSGFMESLQGVYLTMLATQGLTWAMVNITSLELMNTVKMIHVFTEEKPFSTADFR